MLKLEHMTELKTTALVLLIVGAIDSIRNLPATALFGSSLIFFFIFAAVVFLVPTALVSAQLSSTNTDKSGIYHWVDSAFGPKMAFFSVWLQWINTMVWFPTILSFIAGTLTYLFDPNLAQNKTYLISIILTLFWTMTFINLKGVHTSAKFANFCALVGMVMPMLFIIVMAAVWVALGMPLQIHFTIASLVPSLSHSENWISLTAIMTSFLGIELAMVHIKEVHQPQTTFPKALGISIVLILMTMILGSLAIALILPKNEINLVNGVMQAFTNLFAVYHMTWLLPIMTMMLLMGSLGGITSWIISPAKGLLQAAQSGYLPKWFAYENQHGVASYLLMTQAGLVTLVCLAFLFMPSVNGSYWLLSALSTQLYMLMYVILFMAAICLKQKSPAQSAAFTIPGGKMGTWFVCIVGLMGCAITLMVGFIPPDGINVGGIVHYEMIFSGGIAVMIAPVILFMNNFLRETA